MKISDQIDPRYRSLLQKAARRGHVNLVLTISTHIGLSGPTVKRWFTQQATVTTFRVCWPLALELNFTRRFYSKVAATINAARSVKNQDAAGLGAMAYALDRGDRTVLSATSSDREVKIVASAIERPDDFWAWIEDQDNSGRATAIRRFRNIGNTFDRTVIKSAAYLATVTEPQDVFRAEATDDRFPYWIAFDHHVRQGQQTLAQISRDLHIPLLQLIWIFFYFEGSRTQKRLSSVWWDRYCRWRFKKAGMTPEQAHLMWQSARPQLTAALTEDARRLHREIYRWKKAHLDQISELKTEVAQFISPSKSEDIRQKPLF